MRREQPPRTEGLPDVVERGRALLTVESLCRAAPQGRIAYIRLGPANHHNPRNFDAVFVPASSDREALAAEIGGEHPLCSLCHRPRISECAGHRVAIQLPFYMIQPQFADIFLKFLNAVCLNWRPDRAAEPFYGCGAPRAASVKRGVSVVAGLSAIATTCRHCGAARAAGVKSARFVRGEHGGIAYLLDRREHPVSLSALMQHVSASPFRETLLGSAAFYGMRLDIRAMVTDKLALPPYQLRPNAPGHQNPDTALYAAIAEACARAPYPEAGRADAVNVYPAGGGGPAAQQRAICATVYRLIEELHASKPKSPDALTLFLMLPGKNGAVRGHVMAAYANNVFRAVVCPSDRNFGEFVASRYFQALTTEVRVNRYNLDELQRCADAGLVRYHRLRHSAEIAPFRKGGQVHLGDTVWRHVVAGDVLVANRQPTLHRLSLMGNTLRWGSGPVCKLHPCETVPYNADFDGDEMNATAAPNSAAALELRTVGHAVNNVAGPGGPAMAPVFHELAVLRLMCIRAEELPPDPRGLAESLTPSADRERRFASYPARRAAARAAGLLPPAPESAAGEPPLRTYRDALSLLFPEDFHYERKELLIWRGVLVRGELEKRNVGLSAGSITHALGAYPRKRAALFLNDVCRLCAAYMLGSAISFDPQHMIHPDPYYAEIRGLVSATRAQLEEALQLKAAANSQIEREQLEGRILMLSAAPVQQIRERIGDSALSGLRRVAALRREGADPAAVARAEAEVRAERAGNVFNLMFESGCRGSLTNAMQMTLTLGAQYTGTERTDASQMSWIANPRAAPAPDGRPRQSILGNGIIDSSFMNGLTPEQYAAHASPVRHQIVRSKMEVAETGYLSKMTTLVLGQYVCTDDMATAAANTVISHTMGGHLNPTALFNTRVDGHGHSTFADIRILVGRVNYAARTQ